MGGTARHDQRHDTLPPPVAAGVWDRKRLWSHCPRLRQWLQSHGNDEGRCLLTMDLENAFNQMDRSCFPREVWSKLCPDQTRKVTFAAPATTSCCADWRQSRQKASTTGRSLGSLALRSWPHWGHRPKPSIAQWTWWLYTLTTGGGSHKATPKKGLPPSGCPRGVDSSTRQMLRTAGKFLEQLGWREKLMVQLVRLHSSATALVLLRFWLDCCQRSATTRARWLWTASSSARRRCTPPS